MRRLAAVLVMLSALCAGAQTVAASPDHLAPVAWMAGGMWHGEAKGPDGKLTKVETRFERELDGKAISFTTTFNSAEQYRGYMAYDAAKKAIVFSYPSSDGSIVNGTVTQAVHFLQWDLTSTDVDGSVDRYEVHIHQDDADAYTWSLFAPKGTTPTLTIHYHRTRP